MLVFYIIIELLSKQRNKYQHRTIYETTKFYSDSVGLFTTVLICSRIPSKLPHCTYLPHLLSIFQSVTILWLILVSHDLGHCSRALVSYFVECPSVWVCLLFFHNLICGYAFLAGVSRKLCTFLSTLYWGKHDVHLPS